jgi:carboxy-terminal domain RNA polymerase II polypeptide A small phosphatase
MKHKSKPTKKKNSGPSLVSKLLRTLVPCFGPPAKQNTVDRDVEKSPPPAPPISPSTNVREKQPAEALPELKPVEQELSPPPTTVSQDMQLTHETTPIPPPLQPVDIPPPSDDPAVVVPPTPTKTLPPEETAGLTSGAVQPPGSTGSSKRDSMNDVHRDPDSENESDASTSFTDEEGVDTAPIEDPEDEEERLIANGGAGIPIGPVC